MADFPETADIETASDDYASRFASKAGQWMLEEQATRLLIGVKHLEHARILDVGGGHAQTAVPLADAGHDLTVTGSDASCANRLPDGMRFQIADHLALPFDDRSFDATISFRLIPHCDQWSELITELCRCSKDRVIVDYPTRQSLNVIADKLFSLKKKVEKNTRPFTLFSHSEIESAFRNNGFQIVKRAPQFFWPMVIHRMLNQPGVSKLLEAIPRLLGLTALFGSPVVLIAERNS